MKPNSATRRRTSTGITRSPQPKDQITAKELRRRLLQWYERHRRDLPWRTTNDAYRIWISEVMLQQTRVQAVIPYYHNFLRVFPDVRALAKAPEAKLLATWSGLGYYSRARNLQRAAQAIVEQHGGIFPRDFGTTLALPGVGRYTASAVLSIAYQVPLAVLDGNVARVLSRLFAISANSKTASGREILWRLADDLISAERPGDFNQAMMELGATICLPQAPRCPQCPLRRSCVALIRNEMDRFPPPSEQPQSIERRWIAAIVRDPKGRLLMVQRPEASNWLGGFWEIPMWEETGRELPHGIALRDRIGMVPHTITKHKITVAVFSGSLTGTRKVSCSRWFARREFSHYPVTTITRKALALERNGAARLG
jgi:A/G-specific adenine glycosylase